jgi:hypothetical protein
MVGGKFSAFLQPSLKVAALAGIPVRTDVSLRAPASAVVMHTKHPRQRSGPLSDQQVIRKAASLQYYC